VGEAADRGFTNIVDAHVADGRATTAMGTFHLGGGTGSSAGTPAEGGHRLLIRPDAFRLQSDGPITAVVRSATFRGDHTVLRVVTEEAAMDAAEAAEVLEVQADWSPAPAVGERLRLDIEPAGLVLLELT
jgi:ABC-type Fe3+/spermidine/putrescine transport system ATPase subunit